MDNNGCPKHISWKFLLVIASYKSKMGGLTEKETQKSKHLDLNYAERSHIVLTNSLHGLAFGLLVNRKFSNNTDGYFTSVNLSPIAPNLVFCSLFSFEYKTSSKTISHKRNKLFLPLTKNGDFTICSYYHKLHGSSFVVFPWKGIWKVKAPRRISFFVWIAAWDRILTGDNLRLRGLTSLIGALCVVAVVRQWIICCYIVERLISYGALSLGFLGFHGFPHVRYQIFYLGGGIGWGSIHLTFGT